MSIDENSVVHNNMATTEKRTFNLQLFAEGDAPATDPASATPLSNDPPPAAAPPVQQPPAQPASPTTQPTPGAPEQYADFKMAEGFTVQPEAINEFKTWAKTNNMTQEMAQGAIDLYIQKIAPQFQKMQESAFNQEIDAWTKESEKLYGKDGIEAANKALGRFSDAPGYAEFVETLKTTGFSQHPTFIGMFKTINDKISESTWIAGGTGSSITVAQRHFPNSKHNL